ncbi:XRE family transcriptional regulator [candidate division WWE3 bacterium]|uniref:XRE family transcriptional regulator n=1 Tax=candidate division WWE3 bacterium TaxID=2053526 RepID=A0A3A4ZMB8_UNCKA|nr:MAG: XRE family transcriptional regulator [candidate division WWE3 bacterium]
MATLYEKVGINIKYYRKKLGLSQEQLAFKAKIDMTSVSETESGLRNTSLKTIAKLAKSIKYRAF